MKYGRMVLLLPTPVLEATLCLVRRLGSVCWRGAHDGLGKSLHAVSCYFCCCYCCHGRHCCCCCCCCCVFYFHCKAYPLFLTLSHLVNLKNEMLVCRRLTRPALLSPGGATGVVNENNIVTALSAVLLALLPISFL